MNKSEVERFVTAANNNVAIQNDLLQRVEIPAVVEVANKHGYNITAEDVLAYTQPENGTAGRTFRFTNIRANASALSGGSAAGATPVVADK